MGSRRLQKSNRTKLIKEKMKYVDSITADRYEEVSINECYCPKCKKSMKITKNRYKDYLLNVICVDCNYKGKLTTIKRKDGSEYYSWYALPADEGTRHLRDEAHYYFDKIIKERVFSSQQMAYRWLSEKLLMSETKCHLCHIGHMNSAFCKKTIEYSIEVLYNNRNRLSEPVGIYNKAWSYSKNSENLKNMLAEI